MQKTRKTHNKAILPKIMAAGLALCAAASSALASDQIDGTEFGNSFMPYKNRVCQFETLVPTEWTRMEFDEAVSFFGDTPASIDASQSVTIAMESMPTIKSLDDLQTYLNSLLPSGQWAPVKFGEREGFESRSRDSGAIFLLRTTGTVATIRYRISATDPQGTAVVDVILKKLKFLEEK